MISEASPNVADLEAVTPPPQAGSEAPNRASAPLKTEVASPAAFKRLLVAVDDSEQAAFAIDAAAQLAKQLQAELMLVNVFRADVGFTPEFAFAEPDVRTAVIEKANDILQQAKQRASTLCAPSATFLREGDAATEILDVAMRVGADLIVIGTHGRGRLGHALLGSVASSVVRNAFCPVVMISHRPIEDRSN